MGLLSQKDNARVVIIPSFGECTLLALNVLPERLRNYRELNKTAKGLSLEEFPELRHHNLQEIFKTIVTHFSENNIDITTGITIWISGIHQAYSLINLSQKDQKTEECVTVMEIFICEKIKTDRQGKLTGYVYMTLEEMPVILPKNIEGDDDIFCLFVGE